MDIRLYTASGNVVKTLTQFNEQMNSVKADSIPANGIEILAGKVVKFFLTEKGSDALEPDYGGISMHHVQLSSAYLPKLRLEILDDISRCIDYIRAGEITLPDTDVSERIYSITLKKIVYQPTVTPGRLDVYLDIMSVAGKHEVVAVTSNTES